MLVATDISVTKGGYVESVSAQFVPGQVTAIVGPNGAGKSSLLRALMTGKIASGAVQLGGQDIQAWTAQQRAQHLALLSQKVTLEAELTVAEVVALGLYAYPHVSHHLREQVVQAALLSAGAMQWQSSHYQQLSGGQQQRVQLARVLAQLHPSLTSGEGFLLLDEVTASLDIQAQLELLAGLRRQCSAKLGVVLVLHDINLALEFADQVYVMQQGKVVAHGKPEAVLVSELVADVWQVKAERFAVTSDQYQVIFRI